MIVAVAAGLAACAEGAQTPQPEPLLGAGEIPPSPATRTYLDDAGYPCWRVAPEAALSD